MITALAVAIYVFGGLLCGAISSVLMGYINKMSEDASLIVPIFLSAGRMYLIVHAINYFLGIPFDSTTFSAIVIFDCVRSFMFALNAFGKTIGAPHMFTAASVGSIAYALWFFFA